MVDRVELTNPDVPVSEVSQTTGKKPFVTPMISVPVDVLEATTFFQSVESGATN
jgi:hypothetical protein